MPWMSIAASVAGPILGGLMGSDSASNAANIQQQGTDKAVAETQRQYNQTRADLAPYRDAGSAALSRLRSLLGLDGGGGSGGGGGGGGGSAPTRDQFMKSGPPSMQLVQNGAPGDEGSTWSYQLGPSAPVFDQAGYDAAMSSWQGGQGQQTSGAAGPDSGSLLRKFSNSDLAGDVVYNSGLQFGLDEGEKALQRRAAAAGGADSGATYKALARFANDYGTTKATGAYDRYTGEQDRTFGKLSGIAGMGQGSTNTAVQAGTNSSSNLSNLYTGQANAGAASTIAGGNSMAGGLSGAGNALSQYQLLSQLTGGGARSSPSLTSELSPGQYSLGNPSYG